MFGRHKHPVPAPPAVAAAPAPEVRPAGVENGGSGVLVPAVALLCDAYLSFVNDEALRGWAASVLRSSGTPRLRIEAHTPVEAATGFRDDDHEARAELEHMLVRAMAAAGVDPQGYEFTFFTARSEQPPTKVWCLAPIVASLVATPAPSAPAPPVRRSPEEITARLEQIDVELADLRRRITEAVNAPSDTPGGNVLIASFEQMLGRAAPSGGPTLGDVRTLEQERDQLRAELARLQPS